VDDRGFFQKDHGYACPGLVKVDFYGDGQPTLALVLVTQAGTKRENQLVVAHRSGDQWKTVRLDTMSGENPPVVWGQKPDVYTDIEKGTKIRATHPVLIFCGYESWRIVYAWNGTHVGKVWLAD
jgi:hypothetical protein